MDPLRNKGNLAGVKREVQDEQPSNNLSWDTDVRRVNEEYITQVSEGMYGKATKEVAPGT